MHGALAANGARERHHGRGTEQANTHAGSSEAGFFGGHHQIARGRQLAACGSGNALHFGDYRLWNRLNLLHQIGAGLEQLAIVAHRAAHHLIQIMPCGKDLARCGQNNAKHFLIHFENAQQTNQFLHQVERKRVTFTGPI